jgi:hypothetical protein
MRILKTMSSLALACVVACFPAVPAMAQSCVDYGAGVHVTASVAAGARYLATAGGRAYLSSLHTVDISQPGQLVDRGEFAGPDGTVSGMAVSGASLVAIFTAAPWGTFGGLAVFDLSAPDAPVLSATLDLPGIATALVVTGGRAYVRTDDGKVAIVDLADPSAPVLAGYAAAGNVTAFDAAGATVYAYDLGSASVRVVDATNAAAPQIVASWPEAEVQDVELAFGRLYIYAGAAYDVYSLANPLAPVFAQALPVIDRPVDFDGAQAAAYGFPARFWDLADPLAPVNLATIPYVVHAGSISGTRALVGISDDFSEVELGDGSAAGATGSFAMDQAPTGLAVLGNYALAIKEMGLDVLDASVCGAPVNVASLLIPGLNDGYVVAGDWLYILVRMGSGSALQVVDLRNPASPLDAGFVPVSSSRLAGLTTAAGYLYTARGSNLIPINVTDPANPVVLPGLSGLGFGPAAAAFGSVLVAADIGEVRTFSLADPAAPALVGVLPTELYGRSLILAGNTAYLLHDDGIALFDVTNPASIAPLGSLVVPGSLDGFTLAGNYLYVEGNGIHVVDVTDKAAPAFVGSLPYGSETYAPLAAIGSCLWFAQYVSPDQGTMNIAPLYCADNGGGGDEPLQVAIDIRPGDGENHVNCRHREGVIPVAILTTADFNALDVDHTTVRFGPGLASETHFTRGGDDDDDDDDDDHGDGRGDGHGDGHGDGRGHGHGDNDGDRGGRDGRDGRGGRGGDSRNHDDDDDDDDGDHDGGQPVMVRHEEDVDHDGDLDLVFHFRQEDAQIACGDQFAVLTGVTFAGREITGQDAVNASGGRGRLARELPAPTLAPNPFNPQTHVMFSLAQSGRVQVSVYDVAGRRVAVVADGMFDAGSQDVLWTGTDDAGRAVSSGVYFVRIEGAGLAVSLRAALLR